MSITKTNVKLMASERLTDYENGGGMMSPNEVIDGEVNNLFPDISRLDRVYGRVSLRKAFLSVQTALDEMFYGSHAIITDPPDDDTVTVTMFSTDSYSDERSNAKNRIESYLNVSVESRYRLFGQHLTGQRALLVFCDSAAPDPTLGATFVLRELTTADPNSGSLVAELYVRVQRIMARETRTFTQSGSSTQFQRDVITLEISAALERDFPGAEPDLYKSTPAKTKIHETIVADAARYYGVSRLSENAAIGDRVINVPTIFSQLVPSAQSETPAVDQPGAADRLTVKQAGTTAMTVAGVVFVANTAKTIYFPRPITPGTFSVSGLTGTDDGGGGYSVGTFTGTINYAEGFATLISTAGTTNTLSAMPGAAITRAGFSDAFPITITNRSYNYVMTLDPIPVPGTYYVDFMAQGKWYRLRDNGAGQLVGVETTHGSGTINYTTGSIIVTCGALPDVNSSLMWGWGTAVEFSQQTAITINRKLKINLGAQVWPASLGVTIPKPTSGNWTLTSNAGGVLSGDAGSGVVNYATGEITITLAADVLPSSNATIALVYTSGGEQTLSQTFASSLTLTPPPKPGSVIVEYSMFGESSGGSSGYTYISSSTKQILLRDDGTGFLKDSSGTNRGTINYGTGAVSINYTSMTQSVSISQPYPNVVALPQATFSGG